MFATQMPFLLFFYKCFVFEYYIVLELGYNTVGQTTEGPLPNKNEFVKLVSHSINVRYKTNKEFDM